MNRTNYSELDNFVLKARQLWKAGKTAHLHFETHQGHAWCALRVELGPAQGPVHHQQHQHQVNPKRTKSPSYYRRLEARAAARAANKKSAEEVAQNVVEDSINNAVQIAEEAVAKKEAEEAAIAWARAAVVAVGTDVAATATKVAEKAARMKAEAEEAIAKKKAEDAAAKKKAEEGTIAAASDTKAVMADVEIVPALERISAQEFLKGRFEKNKDLDTMKIPPRWPAPEWFCELLGTRKHHGHVKFIISDSLRHLIGRHSDYVITNYMFTKKLWAFMSHLPMNEFQGFIPSPEFAKAVYFKEKPVKIIPWSELCTSLQEHVYFNSSLVGVWSGKKLRL